MNGVKFKLYCRGKFFLGLIFLGLEFFKIIELF